MTRDLITVLTRGSDADRHWCGNDEKGRFRHHGTLPMSHDPVTIELHWRANDSAAQNYIGTYRLHLAALLENDFIRRESERDHVRVQFLNDNGVIKLTLGKGRPGLVVGMIAH
jgi:hypothetical protein